MLIDWFTVGAQLLNFMILVWLMKRFLYRPILEAIAAREKIIADKLASADADSQQARQEKARFDDKNQQFAKQRDALLQQATDEAETERQRLLDDARQAVSTLEQKSQQAMKSMEQAVCQSVSDLVQQELFQMTSKALRDLADVALERQMVLLFIKRLQHIDPAQQQALLDAIDDRDTADGHDRYPNNDPSNNPNNNPSKEQQHHDHDEENNKTHNPNHKHQHQNNDNHNHKTRTKPLTLLSSQPLNADLRAQLTVALEKFTTKKLSLKFVVADSLVCGISLETDGFTLGWSVAEYLAAMQSAMVATAAGLASTGGAANIADTGSAERTGIADTSGSSDRTKSAIATTKLSKANAEAKTGQGAKKQRTSQKNAKDAVPKVAEEAAKEVTELGTEEETHPNRPQKQPQDPSA
jgi:alternate F1F0 ATPase F0 subunit B